MAQGRNWGLAVVNMVVNVYKGGGKRNPVTGPRGPIG
jgi:hypothetical protein